MSTSDRFSFLHNHVAHMIENVKPKDHFAVSKELLQHCPAAAGKGVPVYISGSVVEGFGNSMSDIDVFVISDIEPEGELLIRKDKFVIDIKFDGNRRVDFEYWKPKYVNEMAEKLKRINPGNDFVAEKLSPLEELFIHRIRIAIPIQEEDKFRMLRSIFDFEKFSRYLIQQAIHRIDGAIEDLVGMLDDNDLETAVFRSIMLVGITTDAWCYHRGQTNTLEKWRVKKLALLQGSKEDNQISNRFFNLSLPGNSVLDDDKAKAFVESCMNFAHETCFLIQK